MIIAENIEKSFGSLKVLKGVDLHIKEKEIVSIAGASGAGKTTLLQILGTLLPYDSGLLKINGIASTGMKNKALSRFRNENIGFVFQFHHLLPEFTAHENVCIPGFISGKPRARVEKNATDLLKLLGLEQRSTHKPSELSGGEQQRVAVARALINDPAVILADEPSGNLDTKNKEELHKLFFDLREKLDQTFVIVTHDTELAGMSDRTLFMKDGVIIGQEK